MAKKENKIICIIGGRALFLSSSACITVGACLSLNSQIRISPRARMQKKQQQQQQIPEDSLCLLAFKSPTPPHRSSPHLQQQQQQQRCAGGGETTRPPDPCPCDCSRSDSELQAWYDNSTSSPPPIHFISSWILESRSGVVEFPTTYYSSFLRHPSLSPIAPPTLPLPQIQAAPAPILEIDASPSLLVSSFSSSKSHSIHPS